ncbi:TonB-dependent receptor [Novosphingobium sp. AAP83]|uniref:TonB-dependent receptor n=1 Tax=Novosphingobium sp. AAP83 TaxID=1523425 RepID=UPI0009EC0E32|nr:TonB-dependent receptor [Novosphingobium sp. AAP83]
MSKLIKLSPLLLIGISQMAMAQSETATVSEDEEQGIKEIVVTAEFKETTVQRSSLSLQVLSRDEIATVRRPNDLNALVPGVQIGSSGPNPQVFIRGVGDAARNSRAQSGVVFNIDGVALVRPSAATANFFDLERIEVLKGPQGTLYGRNASGGVLNLITARPKLDETSGFASFEAGNFNLVAGEAAINLPLGEKVALRVSSKIVDRDGYLSDGAQDQRTRAGRLRLFWKPSDSFDVMINADASHVGGKGSGVTTRPVFQNNPWYSNTDTRLLPFPFQFGPGTAPFTAPTDRSIDADLWGVSAEINADLGFGRLTFVPAYRTQKQEVVSFNSNFRFSETVDDRTISAELRLAGEIGDLEWILGGFYFDFKNNAAIYPGQGSFNSSQQFVDRTISKAVFGNAIYSVSETLRLIGGLRYTNEATDGTFVNGRGAPPVIPFVPTSGVNQFAPLEVNKVNWKFGLELDVAPQSMLYATGTSGFKGGGTNSTPCGGPSFGPEDVRSFLFGSRNRFFGNALQVNGEAFLTKTQGQQVSALTQVCAANGAPGPQGFMTFNVGRATVYGGNIDLLWKPTANGSLHFFAEYLKSRADSFSFSQIGAGAYTPAQLSLCSATAGTAPFFNINCDGLPLPRVPTWTIQADYSHKFVLANEGEIVPKVFVQRVTSRFLDIAYGPNGTAPAYTNVNFEVTYTPPGNGWILSAFATNITNAAIYTSGVSVPANAPNGVRYYTAHIEPPRMFGARLQVNF